MHSKIPKNKKFIIGALSVLILILGAFFIFKRQSTVDVSAAGESWLMQRLPTFTYKRQIEITNPTGVNLTDYQIKITVPYVSEMQSDFDDIRFTSIDGITLLPYWLESIDTAPNPDVATFWVKVPSIPTAGLTYLYMFYGNSTTGTLSSGVDTFDFFDDFIGTSFDVTKWTGAATLNNISPYIATIPTTGTPSTSMLSSISTFGNGYSFRSRVSVASASSYAGWGFRTSDNYYTDMFYVNYPVAGSFGALSRNPYPANKTEVQLTPTTGYHIYDISRNSTVSAIYSVDNTVVSTITTNLPTTISQLPASFYGHAQAISVDWVAVRKFVMSTGPTPSEPTYVMWAQQLSTASKAWDRRKAITIINTGTALTDYQVPINVTYDSDMQTDFDDLRFTDSTGATLLSYWIESIDTVSNPDVAKVWVKVPTISNAAATIIYMYYGNGWTGPGSSGANTFIFFDDFNNGLSKWIQSSGTAVAPEWVLYGGELKGSNTKDRLKSISTFSVATTPFVLETKHRYVTMADMGFMSGGFYSSYYVGFGAIPFASNWYFNNDWIELPGGESGSPAATDLLTKIAVKSSSAVDLSIANYATGASYGSVSNINRSITSMPIALGERYDDDYFYNYEAYWDWIIVHKYSAVVPTTIFSAEEVPTGVCGSSNGQYFPTSAPTTGLCATGNIVTGPVANGAGIWTWTCTGVGETIPTNCSTSTFIGRYKKSIPINSSGGALTDYQVPITVTYDSDMQPDFDDIRFTDSTGSTLLPYWIESYTSSSTAKVWVKTSLSAGANTIYMYYGNSSTPSASDGNSTFVFFDDFNGLSLDTTKWTSTASSGVRTFANSLMSVSISGPLSWNTITAKTDTNNATVITGSKLRSNTATSNDCDARVGIKTTGNDIGAKLTLHSNAFYIAPLNENVAWGTNLQTFSLGTWYTFELRHDYSSTFYYRVGQSGTWNSWAINPAGTHISLNVLAYTSGTTNADFDWVYQRKYAATEPTVGSFGAEASTINICGSANGTFVASAPSGSALCSDISTNPTVTGAGPWYWTCASYGGLSSSCMAYASSGLPSLSGWSYKKLVTVSSGSSLTNYAMKIDVPYVTGKMNADFSDLRFAKSDGTIYPYWIESIDTVATPDTAKVWVKIPSIATSPATTFYMYYGNSSAPPASKGDDTFLFFDDFSGTIINTTKWSKTDANNFITQNETLNISDGNQAWDSTEMHTNTTFDRTTSGVMVQSKYKTTLARGTNFYDYTILGVKDSSSGVGSSSFIYDMVGLAAKTDWRFQIFQAGAVVDQFAGYIYPNTQYDTREIINQNGAGTKTEFSSDGGLTWTTYDHVDTAPSTFKTGFTHYQGGDLTIDNVIVRKYVSSEPTASLGGESSTSSGPRAETMYTAGQWDPYAYCEHYFDEDTHTNLLDGDDGNLHLWFTYKDDTPGAYITDYMIAIGTSSLVSEAEINTGWVETDHLPTDEQLYGRVWVKISPGDDQIAYGTTYNWWVKVRSNSAESDWATATFTTPVRHFSTVRVVPVATSVDGDIQLCSGTDISDSEATCYSTCWKGTGPAVVGSTDWKCSVCYDGGTPVSCSTNGNIIIWKIPGTLGDDYSFAPGDDMNSPNPFIHFTSTAPKTVGLEIEGSPYCGNEAIIGPAGSLLPKWREVSPL
ncbi:MAG: DUF2341 domain-containing protein [Candidatus Paceibacterota bacterium]|jgi:hypothetical protein